MIDKRRERGDMLDRREKGDMIDRRNESWEMIDKRS